MVVGAVGVMNGLNSTVPPGNSDAYNKRYRVGWVGGPAILIGIGLRLALRNDGSERPSRSRVAAPYSYRQRPPPPMVPSKIPVSILCSCGQNYTFEVEPVAGRMPGAVACPSCAVDGTEAANASIAQTLAAYATAPARSPPHDTRRHGLSAVLITAIALAGVVVLLLVGSVAFRIISRTRSPHLSRNPTASGTEPGDVSYARDRSATRTTPLGDDAGSRRAAAHGKPGSARDAAPVAPDAKEVEVFWGSRWWAAEIIRRDGSRALIHYDGWNSSFDEWVTPERMRPRR